MARTVTLKRSAEASLCKLPKNIQRRIAGKIDMLSSSPGVAGEERVRDSDGLYRIRVGDYRIAYFRDATSVQIVLIGDRKDIYKALKAAGYVR